MHERVTEAIGIVDYRIELEEIEARLDAIPSASPDAAATELDKCGRRLLNLSACVPSSRTASLFLKAVGQYYYRGWVEEECLRLAALAVATSERDDDLLLLRKALSIQGLVLAEAECIPDAVRSVSMAMDLASRIGDTNGFAVAWVNMGVAMAKGRLFREAIDCGKRALSLVGTITSEESQRQSEHSVLIGLSEGHFQLQEFDQALAWANHAITTVGEARDQHSTICLSVANSVAARCLIALRRVDEAKPHVIASNELGQRPGVERAFAEGRAVLGLYQVATGDTEQGLRTLAAALEAARAVRELHLNVLKARAAAFELAGRTDRALEEHRELIRLTLESQMHAIQYTTALARPGARQNPSIELASDSATLNDKLTSLAQRSRRLLRRPSRVARRWPDRGYLAKRARSKW
jgi:tetratricopeptide (TPR) repeat protein